MLSPPRSFQLTSTRKDRAYGISLLNDKNITPQVGEVYNRNKVSHISTPDQREMFNFIESKILQNQDKIAMYKGKRRDQITRIGIKQMMFRSDLSKRNKKKESD